jgi:hypothetical protein
MNILIQLHSYSLVCCSNTILQHFTVFNGVTYSLINWLLIYFNYLEHLFILEPLLAARNI